VEDLAMKEPPISDLSRRFQLAAFYKFVALEELDALRLEVVGLREELEAERMGGGGSAGGGSAQQQQQQQQQVAAKRRVLTPGGSRLVATPSTVSSQSASVASQNLPPGLKASSLGAIKGVK
jgi:hypothetical protein